ncbi:DUF4249 domain-containing protein [Salmonirosea aquatica]|uniref:DUF4249 domain-containing protein n=1 Tax=Salmonirosea aquatica TaxID=2654236 RepID=UPI0035716414
MAVLALKACVEPFAPPEITGAEHYLVVDGSLNTTPGASSQIRLSRTQNIYEKGAPQPESRAKLTVEGDKGSSFAFAEAVPGVYDLAPTTFRDSEKYRLRIKTSGGREYLSAYVPVVRNPPIDSLTYRVRGAGEGVQIYVNTHDPQDRTRFYRWSYEETWQYSMPLYSAYELVGKEVVFRNQDINTCWSSANPTTIVLGTSVKLSKDIIRDQGVTFVPSASGKLQSRYSILVRQYALTQQEYEYWNALSKTTERTGSLFDPQPAEVTGNIRSVGDAGELVFGYFSASNRQEQRLFVTEYLGRPNPACEPTDTLTAREILESLDLILTEYYSEGSFIPQYIMGAVNCTDCRLRGGTIQKPLFWK